MNIDKIIIFIKLFFLILNYNENNSNLYLKI